MEKSFKREKAKLAKVADKATKSIGSVPSLLVHSFIFIATFLLPIIGVLRFEQMLLILTTALSLEAIYLAIFIQMSVNKNTEDIEDIQEDIEDIEEDMEEIQKDVEEIQEDIEEIEEDDKIEITKQQQEYETLVAIHSTLAMLQKEIEQLKRK